MSEPKPFFDAWDVLGNIPTRLAKLDTFQVSGAFKGVSWSRKNRSRLSRLSRSATPMKMVPKSGRLIRFVLSFGSEITINRSLEAMTSISAISASVKVSELMSIIVFIVMSVAVSFRKVKIK